MFKNIRFASIIFAVSLSILLYSCTTEQKKDGDSKGKPNAELLKTDEKGQKVTMKILPKVGEKFTYKMVATTTSKEKSPATADQEITSEQTMSYYYTQEVSEISESGYITYKMKYDSIMIVTKAMSQDSTLMEVYNSNVMDSVHSKIDFVQYNALAGKEFKFRLSPRGEISDVYELEQIHEAIFKSLGDTLKADEKAQIKESMGSDALKAIIQNQFQKFPETEVYKDSSWTFTNETLLSVFPVRNLLSYKLTNIKTEEAGILLDITATLGIDFIEKEHKERGLTVKINDSKAGGEGNVTFNLSKGCIVRKETRTNIDLDMRMSAKGQSAKSNQTLATHLVVELL